MIPACNRETRRAKASMSKRTDVTCNDCYFRQAGLCALVLEHPCPTFRSHNRGLLLPPPQARLVARTGDRLAARQAAA